MKITTLFRLLFSFILIGLFGCEIEQINPSDLESVEPETEMQAKTPELNYITHKAIPDIMEEIKGRTLEGEVMQTLGRLSYNNVDIDLDEIMEVVSESNETNFTFALDVENTSEYHIYNLVIGKDANGNIKEPYVIGYEMEPEDMKAFFQNGLDYSKFKTRYRYYSFESFFADSKLNKVGKNGDCGGGTSGGGDPISQTPSGGTFTHEHQGSTVTNVFNTGSPQLPYQYTVNITSSEGTTSTSTTEAETQVETITAEIQTVTGTTTITSPGPNVSHTTYSYTVTVAPDSGLGSGGGATYTCVHTVMIIGDVKIETTVCDDGNAQKRYTGHSVKTDGCPNTEGAVAINTAAKTVKKLFHYLNDSLSPLEIDYFDANQEKAKSINTFLIAEGFSQDAKNFAYKAVNAFLLGGEVDFEDKIINDLFGKAKCAHDLLTTGSSSNLVTDILNDFAPLESEMHLNIKSTNTVIHDGKEVNGVTHPPVNNGITIEISSSKANARPILDVAKTVMHEIIHAGMFRALATDNVGAMGSSFKETYEIYESKIFKATAQHNTMADLYIDKMASALEDIHKNVMPGDYNYLSNNGTKSLDDFYEALAWSGLKSDNEEPWSTIPSGRQKEIDIELEGSAVNLLYTASTKNCPN